MVLSNKKKVVLAYKPVFSPSPENHLMSEHKYVVFGTLTVSNK